MHLASPAIGFGCDQAQLRVYVAAKPPMQEFSDLAHVQPLLHGQIQQIASHCGNGWRKVFNVYAKLVFALAPANQLALHGCSRWQDWRDQWLLQPHSQTSLLFSPPSLNSADSSVLHIIAGRQHARALLSQDLLPATLEWLDDEFAIDTAKRLIVCPYLDYRQLSDAKIARVAALAASLPQPIR